MRFIKVTQMALDYGYWNSVEILVNVEKIHTVVPHGSDPDNKLELTFSDTYTIIVQGNLDDFYDRVVDAVGGIK